MTFSKCLTHPWTIALCMLLGAVTGTFLPAVGVTAFTVGALYLAIVGMVALPLQVVAGFFGLRQVAALPRFVPRVTLMIAISLALVAGAAFCTTTIGSVLDTGSALSAETRAQLGSIIQRADAGGVSIDLVDRSTTETPISTRSANADAAIPDNFYRVLAEGRLLGIFVGTTLFGLAFAALPREQTQALGQILDGAYRALETVIDKANLFIPVLAFGMTAHLMGQTGYATIRALGTMLGSFFLLVALLGLAAVVVVSRGARTSIRDVITKLKASLVISLTSGSPIAAIPNTIDAMSTQLGFSRGITELLIPFGFVFVRAGTAVYYASVAIFIAHLYHRTLTPGDLLLVWLSATGAAFLSAGYMGAANIGHVSLVLLALHLPADAVIPILVSVDPICNGPRNVLSLLAVCALTALASAGLPSERRASPDRILAMPVSMTFVLTGSQAALTLGCAGVIALFVFFIGMGIGAR
ncbi:cation:dicarboxylase symporter family transporter [Robbsia sp. Bb-Pol-6]|uniref:Cation:dicarboxylase symporter family transporter n=1 Tax=Robbsia betulipollinis TaxID=2981849 RepID=A0ABT3ZKU3_9BURK|nr:cation:dicarboxylase symporter family transporter [Robbsia betulipollinis]MCY0386972.1 cation:dicarboxylase symporter family transporter [Robbsia betulipollinis]